MKFKNRFKELRKKHGLSQEEMAQRLSVTRQGVSRWETGETMPGIDTLALMSKIFGVSINSLLGQPRNTTCQVCGSPLKDEDSLSREADGTVNEQYCKWCYVDGAHKYQTMDAVIEDVVPRWNWGTLEERREFLRKQLITLEHWRET
jgi:transcriptional regulator with XRE-family HTH domain